MKIIFYNIIYEDFQDFFYIHNFEIIEKKNPSKIIFFLTILIKKKFFSILL